MKIESHTLNMGASHKEVQAKQTGFTAELDDQQRLRISEQRHETDIDRRVNYGVQLRYMMIRQLIQSLCGCREVTPQLRTDEAPPVKMQRLSISERYVEKESISVAMKGHVKSDTMCIDIDLNLSMSRSFVATHKIETKALFYDPLVINFDGELPELETKTFSFDIDNDGENDQISSLKSGNAFLAFDANGNGMIDSGKELFGTITGDGFKELARHDSDGNGWIDDNDPIMHKLRVWEQTEDGNRLTALGETGIGAIYLGSAESHFTYKNAEQEALGRLRSSGLFLYEDGRSGTVAQLDFARKPLQDKQNPLGRMLSAV